MVNKRELGRRRKIFCRIDYGKLSNWAQEGLQDGAIYNPEMQPSYRNLNQANIANVM